jgi:tight adherence protein C
MTPALMALLGVMALLVSGASLIASAIRMNHEAVARRIDMVRLPATTAVGPKNDRQKNSSRLPQREIADSEQREIVRRLSLLGIPADYARACFIGTRLLAAVCLGLIVAVMAGKIAAFASFRFAIPLAALIAALVGWLLPSMVISRSAQRRGKDVAAAMPEALDLLVVCVDAGLSLEDGLSRVVSEMGQSRPALADELALTSADLRILPSRDQALARMADRVDLPSIRSVATTLAQTLRYGTPLAQALRVIANEMRNDAMIQMEQRANQLPALLTIPLMLLIMPTIFLIVGGPAALRIMDIFLR